MKHWSLTLVMLLTLAGAPAGAQEHLEPHSQRIVNGVLTTDFPSVAYLSIQNGERTRICTGTLIGCSTVLTAAHCFCDVAGSVCSPDAHGASFAYFQHGGMYTVSDVEVHPDYDPNTHGHDLAVVRLAQPVDGVAPTPINTGGRVPVGTRAQIAGYGASQEGARDVGIKRAGLVTTAACENGDPAKHLCWRFNFPLGEPGEDSNTCAGDSGGPLFVTDAQGQLRVGGVTSYGINSTCLPADESVDAEVFVDRDWIESVGGADLRQATCGDLPRVGTSGASFATGQGRLDDDSPEQVWTFDVHPDTRLLRVTLNGTVRKDNDFDLSVGPGIRPDANNVLCKPQLQSTFEGCEISSPPAGEWFAAAEKFSGAGDYQLTITAFSEPGSTEEGPCVPGPTTLCVGEDDRFRVEVDWRNQQGDSGPGHVVSTESRDSGLFTFFDPNNWELMVKVLNTCSFSDRIWVFYAATTNQEFTLRVTDTEHGVTKTYFNPLGQVTQTNLDVQAFATCP